MEDKKNILIAEDDKDIGQLISLYLKKEGYNVFIAENGIDAIEIAEDEKVDLALLDIMMPYLDGFKVGENLSKKNIPIIFITARDSIEDRVKGLDLGGDDYITKPFEPRELVARIKALLRRCDGREENNFNRRLTSKDLSVDLEAMKVTRGGEEVSLTSIEFKILCFLMKNKGTIVTKDSLCKYIYGDDYLSSDSNAITVHISKIRSKIEEDSSDPMYIISVRGLGYKVES